MTPYPIRTSGQDNWQPRARSGLSREYVHGPLVPMDDDTPGMFARIFRRTRR